MYENDTDTGIELLYRNKDIRNVLFDGDTAMLFNKSAAELDLPKITPPPWSNDFDIPEYYEKLDVTSHVKKLHKDWTEKNVGGLDAAYDRRLEHELLEYSTRNLFPILRLMIYIMDEIQKTGSVHGVGRGSCCSSYLLLLIRVHCVDPVKYNLDLSEFLKPNIAKGQ